MPRGRIKTSSAPLTRAADAGGGHQVLRGANDNAAAGETCVTDVGALLMAPRGTAAHFAISPPPELLRLVEALARQAAANDYRRAKQPVGIQD